MIELTKKEFDALLAYHDDMRCKWEDRLYNLSKVRNDVIDIDLKDIQKTRIETEISACKERISKLKKERDELYPRK